MSTPSTTKAVGAGGFELSADTVLLGAAVDAAAAVVVLATALFCRLCAFEGASRCASSAKHKTTNG
jgi:thiazole synthase ThiGH ThiG subunit